jgi:hypothetical protein
MNVIGFIKDHDPHVKCSKEIKNLFSDKVISKERLLEITAYLKNGISIVRFISDVYDTDGEHIGPNIIYTDGLWVWPSYYTFYLNKYPQILIPEKLQSHIDLNNRKVISLSQDQKMYMEYMTAVMLGIKLPAGYKIPEEIEILIKEKGNAITCY